MDRCVQQAGGNVRCEEIQYGNFERDVALWADAVILGSGVYNSNADPRVRPFVGHLVIAHFLS